MSTCVICDATIVLPDGTLPGELVECTECGTELEVVSIDPVQLAEAPTEEEDWGQ